MAFRNSAFRTSSYHLRFAISYFGINTWELGIFFDQYLILAYRRMFNTHLLLSKALCAEKDFNGARLLIQETLPYVSDSPMDRAALLTVLVKGWIGVR
jgi:hypothetical protein